MSILFLTATLPAPDHGAGQRSTSILQALRAIAPTRVLLLRHPWHPATRPEGCDYLIEAIGPGVSPSGYYRRRKLGVGPFRTVPRIVRELAQIVKHDAPQWIFCRYALTLPADAPRFAPTLLDLDDVPTDLHYTGFPGLHWLGAGLLGQALRPYRSVFVTKKADIEKIRHPDVRVLPCISPSARLIETDDGGMNMLFMGSRGHIPNAEGMDRFLKSIWPQIRLRLPEATLTIAGIGWEQFASIPGVRVPGFVSSLEDTYREAAVVVCPIWSGAGACVKLAEATGFARAVVATEIAAAGYAGILTPGKDLLAANDGATFARHCIALLQDRALRAGIAASAGLKSAQSLSQPAIEHILRRAFEEAPAG